MADYVGISSVAAALDPYVLAATYPVPASESLPSPRIDWLARDPQRRCPVQGCRGQWSGLTRNLAKSKLSVSSREGCRDVCAKGRQPADNDRRAFVGYVASNRRQGGRAASCAPWPEPRRGHAAGIATSGRDHGWTGRLRCCM